MKLTLSRAALAAASVAFVVIVLGAYVRLSHAGLGCPDWPGCYGELTWPVESHEIDRANEAFPERPVETAKAWKEMVHRYLAGILVLMVVFINYLAWKPGSGSRQSRPVAGFLLVLILPVARMTADLRSQRDSCSIDFHRPPAIRLPCLPQRGAP